MEEWGKYFLSAEAFVVVGRSEEKTGKEVYGTFYIKPNFPGRCSHVSLFYIFISAIVLIISDFFYNSLDM